MKISIYDILKNNDINKHERVLKEIKMHLTHLETLQDRYTPNIHR